MTAFNYYRPATRNAASQPSHKDNRFNYSGCLKNTIKQEKEYEAIANADLEEDDLSDVLLKMMNTGRQEKDITKAPAFTILRSLPGYAVGDTLRDEDEIQWCSKEAAAFAANEMLPNNCAFVLRSDGSYTYSIFNGHANGDSSMSFRVNERGDSKVIGASHLPTAVRVPVLRHRERSPRARGAVRRQHSRSLTSKRDKTTREGRVPTSQARKNRAAMSSSMPPLKISPEAESKTKDSVARIFPVHKRRVTTSGPMVRPALTSNRDRTTREGRVPTSQARKNRAAVSSSMPPLKISPEAESKTKDSVARIFPVRKRRVTTSGGRVHPALSSSLPPTSAVALIKIELKTEDGKTKTVPMYKPGMDVLYKGPTDEVSARIIEVHLTDNWLEPSYTVRLMDGRETQADNSCIAQEPLFAFSVK